MPDSQNERSLRRIFSEARRQEEHGAPAFGDVLDRALRHPARRPRPVRWAAVVATGLVGGLGIAAGVWVALAPDTLIPSSKQPASSETRPISAGSGGLGQTSASLPSDHSIPANAAPLPLTDETVKRLESLGYIDYQETTARGALGGIPGGIERAARMKGDASFAGPRWKPATRADESEFSTESYQPIPENDFLPVLGNPLSTFSIDVDTASYALVRRFVGEGRLPPRDAVRIEELVNYFPYDDPEPAGAEPFSLQGEVASCPWNPLHRLVRIGLRAASIPRERIPGSNLVFLLDVSGSMDVPAKLPLVQSSLAMLAAQLDARDEITIVVYAGASGLVLPPTSGSRKEVILDAIGRLQAGGSTNGGAGLQLAYGIARERFREGGINRVILATDGDFNVGITDKGELLRFVQDQAREGVFLTALGFGMGNYKDDLLELLADRGNGNYAYIDGLAEARKLLVEQVGGTLMTVAKDVKIQVEFNPAEASAYRLIGYENRLLRKEDFNDDRKDAGEMGAGQTVTALYEIVPAGVQDSLETGVDPLQYQRAPETSPTGFASGELLTVKVRWKEPNGQASRLTSLPVTDAGLAFDDATDDLRFAAAVAGFGMVLRESPHKGSSSFTLMREIASGSLGEDLGGHRNGFLDLLGRAETISGR